MEYTGIWPVWESELYETGSEWFPNCQCLPLAQPIERRHRRSICFSSDLSGSQLKLLTMVGMTFCTHVCFPLLEPGIRRRKEVNERVVEETPFLLFEPAEALCRPTEAIWFLDLEGVWFLPFMKAKPLVHVDHDIVMSTLSFCGVSMLMTNSSRSPPSGHRSWLVLLSF